ncbi:MAG: class I SAM-dependent methyltransferase [archaeon]|nr:class I SAM-dependent methyltransferase [archaeon]MDD2477465.1 class I SAM-dependent methyltransferase [Candidatus ainarchaeum sp.]MDD3084748.1 class I SAM-dependent methyltransferase [Candidatus ainarchaeum sp.]MDD4220997.1 class I SAM-dependent methyltransferase [Candidatus ainarchaeum sp.]MDD4662431.1 class I SAM-dependent methyltransferase [Candidatus ainarchaeum sp.]
MWNWRKGSFFAKNGGKVIAIDFTENQLKVAKDYAKRVGVDNKIIFKQKDIINSSLKDLEKFDIIICTGVLHHTEDAYKGFLNLVGLLERNGIIIVGLYHKYARWRFRFIRFLLHLFVSKDYKKLDLWFEKNNFFARFLKRAPKNSVYDRYLVPFESYHTLREVKGWFKKNNLKFVENSKNVDGFEIFKIFERKTLFFVSGHKNK